MNGWVVRNNTFESPAYISLERWQQRHPLGRQRRLVGLQERHHLPLQRRQRVLGGRARRSARPPPSATTTAPFGWVNPAAYDFRLNSGSPAINAGDPNDAPARDREGNARNGVPDAGAYEF